MNYRSLRNWLAVGAVAFVFLVFGIWEIVQPAYWIGFAPPWIGIFISPLFLVRIHGIVLVAVALGLAAGWQFRLFAIAATAVMASICGLLWLMAGFTDILVRDIAILLFAASLIFEPADRD